MPHYHSLGQLPHKRHIQFKKPDGGLYREELMSTEGFSSMYSLTYHANQPTAVLKVEDAYNDFPKIAIENNLQHRSYLTFKTAPVADFLESRKVLFCNSDVNIGVAAPQQSMKNYFYKNATADEMLFVHEGSGVLHTAFGKIKFSPGDYLIIPRGVVYQLVFDSPNNRIFYVESFSPLETPNRYRNEFGQLLEHSPFYERDFRKPTDLETHTEKGEFKIIIRKGKQLFPITYQYHPFDLIGWDGYYYPYAFSIHNFEPITGRVHMPPPIHQTFQSRGFVVCSFCPRMYDYHPQSIPAPYWHSNVDSDELLYYAEGEFMSRKHVERGMISLHPIGIPHGPHPGAVEKSIGQKETQELAVMVDTFKPLMLTENAVNVEDLEYYKSWME